MPKKKSNNKASKDRMFKQMKAKKQLKGVQKEKNLAQQSVTRADLYNVQKMLNTRIDSALMGTAAVVEVLVNNNLCTYEDFKDGEKGMLEILIFIRKAMGEAHKELATQDATLEDVGAFVYEKAIAFGINKDILINVFGVKPTKSRILRPNQVKSIIVPK